MNIRTIARAFGMTVDQFARQVGYSRSIFYQKRIGNTAKSQAMIRDLKRLDANMLQMELETAWEKSAARAKAIEALETICSEGGETNG